MNRKTRRAGLKSGNSATTSALAEEGRGTLSAIELLAHAERLNQQGRPEQAEIICNKILAREPAHAEALNLLGAMLQGAGRHRLAVKTLSKAIAAAPFNAAGHYNIAAAYQTLGRTGEAMRHFNDAIAFGTRENPPEKLILQSPIIAACVSRIEERWPLPVPSVELFSPAELAEIGNDLFLRCALSTVPLRGVALERLLAPLRAKLLGLAHGNLFGAKSFEPDLVPLLAGLAQQCFTNEYIFVQSEEETRRSVQLCDLLLEKSADGETIAPHLIGAVAAYFPLHQLPAAAALLQRDWPEEVASLIRQQLREPFVERHDRKQIPALTPVDDAVTLQVMSQYEENPYPRWTINPLAALARDRRADADAEGVTEILIAGCGSGRHSLEVAQLFRDAQVLAVDISLPGLAYARRKTHEAELDNVDYAQADILKLGTLDRSFDRIEAVGVLHHLAEPESGWRVLLSLLRPNGVMRIGLYSETARQAVIEARGLIAERGYRPTSDDIRKCRQEILRDYDKRRWWRLIESGDFYSMSGCRDLLFNVMEHRFTIPRIKTFLDEQNLSFLGFDPEPSVLEKFQKQFPDAAALTDLEKWHVFETEYPQAFRFMYVFNVRKN
ncbi:MAG TPA: methyltransferase domain-containing protein [Xanthobacteraceae bacterium]